MEMKAKKERWLYVQAGDWFPSEKKEELVMVGNSAVAVAFRLKDIREATFGRAWADESGRLRASFPWGNHEHDEGDVGSIHLLLHPSQGSAQTFVWERNSTLRSRSLVRIDDYSPALVDAMAPSTGRILGKAKRGMDMCWYASDGEEHFQTFARAQILVKKPRKSSAELRKKRVGVEARAMQRRSGTSVLGLEVVARQIGRCLPPSRLWADEQGGLFLGSLAWRLRLASLARAFYYHFADASIDSACVSRTLLPPAYAKRVAELWLYGRLWHGFEPPPLLQETRLERLRKVVVGPEFEVSKLMAQLATAAPGLSVLRLHSNMQTLVECGPWPSLRLLCLRGHRLHRTGDAMVQVPAFPRLNALSVGIFDPAELEPLLEHCPVLARLALQVAPSSSPLPWSKMGGLEALKLSWPYLTSIHIQLPGLRRLWLRPKILRRRRDKLSPSVKLETPRLEALRLEPETPTRATVTGCPLSLRLVEWSGADKSHLSLTPTLPPQVLRSPPEARVKSRLTLGGFDWW